jgi:hypothetical protein
MDESLTRFIETHVRGARCSVCDGTSWSMANDGKAMSFLSFSAAHDPRIDVFGVLCNSCGYMRFHSATVVNSPPDGPGGDPARPS